MSNCTANSFPLKILPPTPFISRFCGQELTLQSVSVTKQIFYAVGYKKNIDIPEEDAPTALLVAQTLDRVKLRSAGSWHSTEYDSDNRRHDDGDDRRQAGNRHAEVGQKTDRVGDGEADHDAGDASEEGDQNSFRQKLEADFAVGRADGFANPNLADARSHRRQHDVHDADATHKKSHQGDQHQNQGK